MQTIILMMMIIIIIMIVDHLPTGWLPMLPIPTAFWKLVKVLMKKKKKKMKKKKKS